MYVYHRLRLCTRMTLSGLSVCILHLMAKGFTVASFMCGPVGIPLLEMPHMWEWCEQVRASPGFDEGYVKIFGGFPYVDYEERGWVPLDWDKDFGTFRLYGAVAQLSA